MGKKRNGGVFNARKNRNKNSQIFKDQPKRRSYVSPEKDDKNFQVQNFCLAFIDLLGQKDAVSGPPLVPQPQSSDEVNSFNEKIKGSVGAIYRTQKRADQLLAPLLAPPKNSVLRNKLPLSKRAEFDKTKEIYINRQRWSDGLVYFSGLRFPQILCPANAVLSIIMMAGALAFLGLAGRTPIRGAVDIAWGVELHPGEIYGAVVARAAELESQKAHWPRIVVSDTVLPLLEGYIQNPATDIAAEVNRVFATAAKGMIDTDVDGVLFVNY